MKPPANYGWVADLETITIETEYFRKHRDVGITLGAIMACTYRPDMEYLKRLDLPLYYEFTTIGQLMEFIERYKVKTLYFHNLTFDGTFIIYWALNNGWTGNNDDVKIHPPKSFTPHLVGKEIYHLKMGMPNTGHRVNIMCSLRKLVNAVEDLGKGLKLYKFEGISDAERETFYNVEPQPRPEDYPQKFREYLKRDCDIVRRSLLHHLEQLDKLKMSIGSERLTHKDLTKKGTVSGLSYTLQEGYAEQLGEKYLAGMKITHEEYQLGAKFYFGGFTQFNPAIQNRDYICRRRGMNIDCNSMHPTSMTMRLPYGQVHNLRDDPAPADAMFFRKYHIKHARTKGPQIYTITSAGMNDNTPDRYLPELDDFVCYYEDSVFTELKHFNDFEGVTVLETGWCHANTFLKRFVDDLYAWRVIYKQNKNDAGSQTVKILLNGAYGKHGQREQFDKVGNCSSPAEKEAGLEAEKTIIDDVEYLVKPEHKKWRRADANLVRLFPTTPKDVQHNKFIAATVTGYSFVRLLQAIRKIGVERFLYCDTDSIYFEDPPANLPELIDIDPNRLGAGKIESEFDVFMTTGAKTHGGFTMDQYLKFERGEAVDASHVKFSGVNKNWLRKNVNIAMFRETGKILKDARVIPIYFPSGIALVKTDYKTKKRYN